ncbi:MAG TPA: hypothetical protein VKT20_01115 [Candidatus Dormibacteraeota bacterium]|nr:hypothetical protein [Candidatus Dormibacteraeota bacterium]
MTWFTPAGLVAFILAWLFVGWLGFGFSVRSNDVTEENWKRIIVTWLTLWPIPLALEILSALCRAAITVFHRDHGLLTKWLLVFRRSFTVRFPTRRTTVVPQTPKQGVS